MCPRKLRSKLKQSENCFLEKTLIKPAKLATAATGDGKWDSTFRKSIRKNIILEEFWKRLWCPGLA